MFQLRTITARFWGRINQAALTRSTPVTGYLNNLPAMVTSSDWTGHVDVELSEATHVALVVAYGRQRRDWISGGWGMEGTPVMETAIPAQSSGLTYLSARRNGNAISVTSRKSYGQPDFSGVTTADPNAEARDINYRDWEYKGGLFVGNTNYLSTRDQSGVARIQMYFANPASGYYPVCLSYVTMGAAAAPHQTRDIAFSAVPSTDANIGVSWTQARWSNRWNLAAAVRLGEAISTSSFGNGPTTRSLNLIDVSGVTPNLIVSLATEASDITSGVSSWRYFASAAYASASGNSSGSLGDPMPRIWDLSSTEFEVEDPE